MKKGTYVFSSTQIPMLEEIIRQYYRARSKGPIRTGQLAALSRGSVDQQAAAGSVAFLTDLGILAPAGGAWKYCLTPFGESFGDFLVSRAGSPAHLWRAAAKNSGFLMDIYDYVKKSDFILEEDLRTEVVARAGGPDSSHGRRGAGTCVRILVKAGLVQERTVDRKHQISAVRSTEDKPFIAEDRIAALAKLDKHSFDLSKLIELCREINACRREGRFYAVGMLVRALLDHVPPILHKTTFAEVVNHYGEKSFKGSMKTLDEFRDVFDGYLHHLITKKEELPNEQQIDCSAHLDILLVELIRVLSSEWG